MFVPLKHFCRLAHRIGFGLPLAAALVGSVYSLTQPAAAQRYCAVKDGFVAEVASGAFSPTSETVTLKSSYKAEFRWDISHKEALGWMRITDADNNEIGWVPAGHEAIVCGSAQ